jgi:hypothetical protein
LTAVVALLPAENAAKFLRKGSPYRPPGTF